MRNTDVVLPVTPMFHVNAWGVPYGAVNVGAKLVFPGPHLHADDLLDLMRIEAPTVAIGVPTIWMSVMQTFNAAQAEGSRDRGRWMLPKGMHIITGGSTMPDCLIRAYDEHGVWMEQGWGMTETSPVGTRLPPGRTPRCRRGREVSPRWHGRRAGAACRVAPMGDKGEQAWDGKSVGEIQVRGPFVTGCYHEVPVTDDKFTDDGWLRTGDVASVDPFGFVRITDRTKDLIKSGGEWISSADLESALMEHPAVAEAAVIAIPDAKWSERPLACIVLEPGKQVETKELDHHLLGRSFAKWQLPERYEFMETIPRTSTGKFWKVKLRELFPN